MSHLIYHTYGNREDCCTRETSHLICNHRFSSSDIDTHTEHCIDECKSVSTSLLARLSDSYDICNIWRKLYKYRLCGNGFNSLGYSSCRLRRCSECHTSIVHIWARDIDLQDSNLLLLIQLLAALNVLLDREATDICNNWLTEDFAQLRQLVCYDCIYTRILQTYRVNQTRWALCDTRCSIAKTSITCSTLE